MSTDACRANAFDALEADIAELSGAEAVLGIVHRGVLERVTAERASHFQIPNGIASAYRVYLLTEEQDEALHHALLHLGDAVRQLDRNYRAVAQQEPLS
ncbi:hypothetical protein ACFPOB_15845 [Bosea eneae]|uniref:Uncharacterized protein n=1 Tax=Bosea eneae TaxID=151454 RepID=A0ABW0IYX7_9HYPH